MKSTDFLKEDTNKNQEIALIIKNAADKKGWKLDVSGDVLTLSKPISNRKDFNSAITDSWEITNLLPCKGGTSYGDAQLSRGETAIKSVIEKGIFIQRRSGGSKRVLSALKKVI